MGTDVSLIDRAPHVKRVSVIGRDEDEGIFIFTMFLWHIRCQPDRFIEICIYLQPLDCLLDRHVQFDEFSPGTGEIKGM